MGMVEVTAGREAGNSRLLGSKGKQGHHMILLIFIFRSCLEASAQMVTNLDNGQGWPWSFCKSRVLQRCQIQEKNWRPDLRAHMEDGEGLRAELSQTQRMGTRAANEVGTSEYRVVTDVLTAG
jgi:hypothetical protein